MAESPAASASSAEPGAAAAPKKSRKMFVLIIIVALVAVGGGGGFFFFQRAKAAPNKTEKGKKSRTEKESEGEAGDEEETGKEKEAKKKGEESKGSKKLINLALPDDAEVKKVIELQPFIVNLADKGEARYLRMTVSLGLGEAKGEEKPDPLFTTRVRNAMLAVLTTKASDEILTVEGKATLRKELLQAAQAASEEPKVEAIYITDFIVQL